MLLPITLGPIRLHPRDHIPPLVQPLVDAARRGENLAPVIEAITRSLGFDSYMHAICASPRPTVETRAFVYTTLDMAWVRYWDSHAFVEVDPRVQAVLSSSLPFVWDQASERGRDPRVDEFLDAAMKYGVASGIAFPIRDTRARTALAALNSAVPLNDAIRRQVIARQLGDIHLFVHYFHEMFIESVLADQQPARSEGAPLTNREHECLTLSARGLTTEDIAERLGIGVRTAQYHFDRIREKLGAANRQEAIARAIQDGLVSPLV